MTVWGGQFMHPMLRLTVGSGIVAALIALVMPLIPHKYRKAVLAPCVIAMLYLTLWRGGSDVRQINLIPLWSYRKWHAADVRWQIYMNVFLFIPYGAILKSLNVKHPVIIAAVTSLMIELIQYLFCLGLCEADDLINNTVGSILGCLMYSASNHILIKMRNKTCKG